MSRSFGRIAFGLVLAWAVSWAPAHAQTYTWAGGVSTDYFLSANWSPSTINLNTTTIA